MAEPREFGADHAWEQEQAHSAWWAQTMQQAFPNAEAWRHATEREQTRGVDFVVWGPWVGGRWSHNVDAKFRRKVWPDILIEIQSNSTTGTAGWAVKQADTDYLAYAWVPSRETWFIPFGWLQTVLAKRGDEWIARYRRVRSANVADFGDYTTTSLPIPKSEIWRSVPNCFRIILS